MGILKDLVSCLAKCNCKTKCNIKSKCCQSECMAEESNNRLSREISISKLEHITKLKPPDKTTII